MNHNLNLNSDGVATVRRALDGIAEALSGLDHDDQRGQAPVMERCLRILPSDLFEELRAYLGTIGDCRWTLDQMLFWIDGANDTEYGLAIENHLRPANPARVRIDDDCPVCGHDDLPQGCSTCQPSLIAASKLRHPSNGANLQRAMALAVAAVPDGEHIEVDQAGVIDLCADDCTCRGDHA